TLPTGSTAIDKLLANAIGSYHRLNDFYLFLPKGFSIRAGVSPMIRSGQLFARVDIGVDGNVSADGTDAPLLVRANGGIGMDTGQVAVMAEVNNLYSTKDQGGSTATGSSWINVGALSARFKNGQIQPYAALVIPLDHDSHTAIDAVVIVGLDAAIH